MKYILVLVGLLTLSCGTKVPMSEQNTTTQTPLNFEYKLYEPTCATGHVIFKSEAEYCNGLKIDSINRDCAKYQREALFEKYCLRKGYSWPKAYSCEVQLYDYRATEPDSKYLLASQNYCLPPKYGYHTNYAKLFYKEPTGRKIGINVLMDSTGQRRDRGDGTTYITTYNLDNPHDVDFKMMTSFHRHGAVWDRLGDYWLYVACSKTEACLKK